MRADFKKRAESHARDAGGGKSLGVPVVKGGKNLPPPVGIGLTNLPKIGGLSGPSAPPPGFGITVPYPPVNFVNNEKLS